MIPIQTLLALLAVLMMFGCSQNAPPRPNGVNGLQGTNQTTASPSPSPSNVPLNNPRGNNDPTVKPNHKPEEPALSKDPSTLVLDTSDARQIKLVLQGGDAQNLYRMTEIEAKLERINMGSLDAQASESGDAKSYVKTGQHYQCLQDSLAHYTCTVTVSLVDGALAPYADPKNIKAKPGRLRLSQQWLGLFLNFNSNPVVKPEKPDPKVPQPGPFFQFNIAGNLAQQLHQALQVGEIEDGVQFGVKYGKRVKCQRNQQLVANDASAYSCILFGTLTDGHFDEIQKPAAK